MAGAAGAQHERAFVRADPAEAGALVAAQLRQLRPEVLVTYDAGGGYGHPDHIQTRRVALAAIGLLAPDERPHRVYEVVTPLSWAQQDRCRLAEMVTDPAAQVPGLDEPYAVSVVPDDQLAEVATHVVHDEVARDRQAHALAAHRTQVVVHEGSYYTLSNRIAHLLGGREAFVRIDPITGARLPRASAGWATGLLHEDG